MPSVFVRTRPICQFPTSPQMGESIKVFFEKKGPTQLKQSTIHFLCCVPVSFSNVCFCFFYNQIGGVVFFFLLAEKSSFLLLFSGDIHEGRECGVHDVIERSVGFFFKRDLLGICNGCKSDQFITVFFGDQSRNLWVHI